eukprot:29974-Pelagococcus_subviridis.AAC.16
MKFTTRTRSYGDQCEIERACDGGYAYSSNSSKKQCVPRRMTATAHGDAFVIASTACATARGVVWKSRWPASCSTATSRTRANSATSTPAD